MAALTPNMAKLARMGTRFSYAYTPAPLCVPARVAFAAGVFYENSSVKSNGVDYLPNAHPTYFDVLDQAGYATMISGKDHLNGKEGVGLDGSRAASSLGYTRQGYRSNDKYGIGHSSGPKDPYGAMLFEKGGGSFEEQSACYGSMGDGKCCLPLVCQGFPSTNSTQTRNECGFNCPVPDPVDELDSIDAWVERNAERLLAEHMSNHSGTPWYLTVGFPSPHPPFILSPSENKTVSTIDFPSPTDNQLFPPEIVHGSRRQYAGLVGRLDRLIGRLIQFLEQRDLLSNTLVMVTSDHGEHLGDWGYFGKASPWEVSTRVPLVVAGPGVLQGRVVDDPVTTLDLVGTMLDYAGTSVAYGMDTTSLRPLLTGQASTPPRDWVPTSLETAGEGSYFYNVVQRFPHLNATLKLVCCQSAETCIKHTGALMPFTGPASQVALMALGRESPGDVENLLRRARPELRHCAEGNEMLARMPIGWQKACGFAFHASCLA